MHDPKPSSGTRFCCSCFLADFCQSEELISMCLMDEILFLMKSISFCKKKLLHVMSAFTLFPTRLSSFFSKFELRSHLFANRKIQQENSKNLYLSAPFVRASLCAGSLNFGMRLSLASFSITKNYQKFGWRARL